MARPQRHNVDYFPHYISDGKKMFIIESKFGNDGYAAWFKILETLAKTDNHWIDLQEESNVMFLSAKCRISEQTLIDLIDAVVKLGEIDSQLWKYQRVIWCQKFIDSIEDAYRKRSNDCITKEGLVLHLKGLGRSLKGLGNSQGNLNPQSKVKNTILEKSKIIEFDTFWSLYDKKEGRSVVEKKWNQLKHSEKEKIIIHVPLYVAATPDKRYRKNAATYLNQKTWLDEELPTQSNNRGQPVKPESKEDEKARIFMENLKKESINQILNSDVQFDNNNNEPSNAGRMQRISEQSAGNEPDKID